MSSRKSAGGPTLTFARCRKHDLKLPVANRVPPSEAPSMYSSGQQQMKSAAWLQSHGGDRPSFQATVSRTFSNRQYQVFAMSQGLLFLELRSKGGSPGNPNTAAVVMGGVMGGAIG